MARLQMWLVRHKPTGHYLPRLPIGYRRGGSHLEPCDAAESPPRVFYSRQAAQAALGQWLRGKFIHIPAPMPAGPDWVDDGSDSFEIEPVETRKRDEMEIIEIGAELS